MDRVGSPTDRITDFRGALRASMESCREEWLAHGRSTAAADRPTAERVWREMYAALGLPPPVVIWFDGPATAILARDVILDPNGRHSMVHEIRMGGDLGVGLGASLGIRFREELSSGVERDIRSANAGGSPLAEFRSDLTDDLFVGLRFSLATHLEATLGSYSMIRPHLHQNFDLTHYPDDLFRHSLWADLEDGVWAGLWTSLAASLRTSLGVAIGRGAEVRASLHGTIGNRPAFWHLGQHDPWRAAVAWPLLDHRRTYAPECVRRLEWWLDLSRSTGWWEPFEHAVIACERPLRQAVDHQGQLHHTSGPALLCRDGWPVHAIHGVRVPGYVVEQPIDDTYLDKIDAHPNAEVRRVMMERFGIERYVAESGFRRVHTDDFGELYRRRGPEGLILTAVRVVDAVTNEDGSPKVHFLWVNDDLRPMRLNEATGRIEYGDPQAMTARNAIASTFGLRGEEYQPALQT